MLARYDAPVHPERQQRKPGRPAKRTPEYLLALLTEHTRLVGWFVGTFGARPASDRQLYTEFFAAQFSARGERAARAKAADFQRPLKTLLNELAEARRIERSNPGNPAISGTT